MPVKFRACTLVHYTQGLLNLHYERGCFDRLSRLDGPHACLWGSALGHTSAGDRQERGSDEWR